MAILFDVVETTKVKSKLGMEFDIRLLKRDDDWGLDSTMSMEPIFGYTEKGARNTYKRIIDSFEEEIKIKRIKEALTAGLLTELESKIMNWLLVDGYFAEYTFSDVEVSDIAVNIEVDIKSVKGSVGSLVKKGYLWVSDREGDVPPLVYATDKGYQLDDNCEERWPEALEGGIL